MRLVPLCALAALAVAPARVSADADAVPRVTLEDVIAAAVRGPRLRVARADTAAARAKVRQARGKLFPELEVTAGLAPSPDIDCLNPECTVTSTKDINPQLSGIAGRLEATATQPLFTFGKLSEVTAAARLAVQAQQALEDELAADLAIEAARAYWGVVLARELRWMLEDGVEQVDKALARVNEKLEEGSPEVTLQDRFRVESLAAEVGSRLIEAREAEAIALAGVRALVDRWPVEVADELLEPVELELEAEERYVQIARNQRAQVRAAELGARAQGELAAFQQSRWWPDVVLIGGVRLARATGAEDPPSAYADDPLNRTSAVVALGLRWKVDPITLAGEIDEARAEAQKARAQADAAAQGAAFDARKAHAEAAAAQQRIQLAGRAERTARGWLASSLQAEAVGAVSSKELADAYVAFFQSRARLLQAIYDWNVAVVRLGRATGEFKRPGGV